MYSASCSAKEDISSDMLINCIIITLEKASRRLFLRQRCLDRKWTDSYIAFRNNEISVHFRQQSYSAVHYKDVRLVQTSLSEYTDTFQEVQAEAS